MNIGFIGLGAMGRHMAASLQHAGRSLTVHDLQRESASQHLASGAKWADSTQDCRVAMTLQEERAGVTVRVPPEQLSGTLD